MWERMWAAWCYGEPNELRWPSHRSASSQAHHALVVQGLVENVGESFLPGPQPAPKLKQPVHERVEATTPHNIHGGAAGDGAVSGDEVTKSF